MNWPTSRWGRCWYSASTSWGLLIWSPSRRLRRVTHTTAAAGSKRQVSTNRGISSLIPGDQPPLLTRCGMQSILSHCLMLRLPLRPKEIPSANLRTSSGPCTALKGCDETTGMAGFLEAELDWRAEARNYNSEIPGPLRARFTGQLAEGAAFSSFWFLSGT